MVAAVIDKRQSESNGITRREIYIDQSELHTHTHTKHFNFIRKNCSMNGFGRFLMEKSHCIRLTVVNAYAFFQQNNSSFSFCCCCCWLSVAIVWYALTQCDRAHSSTKFLNKYDKSNGEKKISTFNDH